MIDLRLFGERIVGGRFVDVEGFAGIEVRKFLVLRTFLSFPYTLPTSTHLPSETLKKILRNFHRGEIALTYPHPSASFSYPSPVVLKGAKYHRERRRLIRRAEERCVILESVPFSGFYALYSASVRKYGRKPIPISNLKAVYTLPGVHTVGVEVEGKLVGAIMGLALEDRFLLWQMGWEGFNFLPTYLLHLGIKKGFNLGYDAVDLGISSKKTSLKLKFEMGGDTERRVYVIRWGFRM